jgi:hypothetical protein
VLRRIFGSKREEVAGGWRRLHNEELHNLYASPNVIRVVKSGRVRWAGHVACIGEMIKAYKILVGKSDRWAVLILPQFSIADNTTQVYCICHVLDFSV